MKQIRQRFSTHTTLIELTLSLMFLMLTSVTILGLFMTAYEKSIEADRQTRAVQLAQNCAALIAASDDPERALAEQGFAAEENGDLSLITDDGLRICIGFGEKQTEVGKLLDAEISVSCGDEVYAQWPAARYYNKEVIHP